MDREGGQDGSALAIQISQAGWTDVTYLYLWLLANITTCGDPRLCY